MCWAEIPIPMVWDGTSVAKGTKVPAYVSCSVSRQCTPLLRGVLGQLVTWMCLTSLSTVPTLGPGDEPRWDRTFGALGTCTGPATGVFAQVLSWESRVFPGHRQSCPNFVFPQLRGPSRSVSPGAETCRELVGFRPSPWLLLCQLAMSDHTAHLWAPLECQVL